MALILKRNTKVLLDKTEQEMLFILAKRRDREMRSRENTICKEQPFEVVKCGAFGEYGFCRMANLFFGFTVNKDFDGGFDAVLPDGRLVDVKTPSGYGVNLCATLECAKSNADLFALVTLNPLRTECVFGGVIEREAFITPERVRHFPKYNSDAYFIEAGFLNDLHY